MIYEVRRQDNKRVCRVSDGTSGSGPGTEPARGAFSLLECPPIAPGNFILLKRDDDGGSRLLAMGRVRNDCASLNLAHVRRLGAELGANEVRLFPVG